MRALEERILRLYAKHGIEYPYQITLHVFDNVLPIRVVYRPGESTSAFTDEDFLVFVDGSLSLPERRVVIAHEIGHLLLHAGTQAWMPNFWRSKQEWQAKQFSFYALTPTPMLIRSMSEYGSDYEYLAETFGVPNWFVRERINGLKDDCFYKERSAFG